MESSDSKILELVVFQTLAGVTRDDVLSTNGPVSTWISQQPGFLSRDLSYDAEGNRWIDVLWWRTLEEAQAASGKALQSDACAPFFALIDMENMLFLHGDAVIPRVGPATQAA